MTTKLSLTLNAKRYDIDVEEGFATFLNTRMGDDFNLSGNNDLKLLLQAYVKTSFALYEQEREIAELIEKLQNA